MTHKARGSFQGEFPGQLESRYHWIMGIINKMNAKVVARTNKVHSLESYLNLHENEYWCDGSDCVKQGFVDDIASVTCDKSLTGTTEQVVRTFFGSFIAVFSQCPLITAPVGIKAPNNDIFVKPEEKSLEELGFIYEQSKEFKFLP